MKQTIKEISDAGSKNSLHREYGAFHNVAFILRRMMDYDKMLIVLLVLGIVCQPFMQYFWTFLPKFILDMVTGDGNREELFLLMVIFTVIQLIFTMLVTYRNCGIEWRFLGARIRTILDLNRKTMKIDFEHLENPDIMDCFQKAQNSCTNSNNGVEGLMHDTAGFVESFAITAVGVCILSSMNIWIVLLMLGIASLNFLVVNHTNKMAKAKVWDPLASWWRKRQYMQDVTTNFDAAKDIRMFDLSGWLLQKYRDLNRIRYEAQRTNAILWFWTSVASNVFWFVSQIFVYAWLVYLMFNHRLTIGNFTLYLASAATLFEYVSTLLNGISSILARSREVDDFRSFLDFDGGDISQKGKALPKLEKYEFVFENVSFKYPKAECYALRNLNLTIKAGERLAVVGLNGAGKSTMIKLLLRLYQPTEGRIMINGTDIMEYDSDSYYAAFAPVFQQVELFAFPMEENVSMKEPERTDRKWAKECLEAAGLEKKIQELPNGTKTELLKIICDDGIDLSGGEKQKLALARALYKDGAVVVLDEPTAALDALAEAKLYEDFDKLIGGKTAVYISHRLSSTRFCDKVAMFADGEMVEYGTHAELMEKAGAYAEMFHIQAQYYIENVNNTEGGAVVHEEK